MAALYDGKLSDLVSRYDKLEENKGSNPAEMRNWKNNALRPVTKHRFLLVEPNDRKNWLGSKMVYVLGKGEKLPENSIYGGVEYATFEIEQAGKSAKEPQTSQHRIVMRTSDGKSHPLREIRVRDITDQVIEYQMKESGYCEREIRGYTEKIDVGRTLAKSAARLRERNTIYKHILREKRERDVEIADALTRTVDRIKSYNDTRERNEGILRGSKIAARNDYVSGVIKSKDWGTYRWQAFVEEHRQRNREIDRLADSFAAIEAQAFTGVKSEVAKLRSALLGNDPITVDSRYGIAHKLHFGVGRYDGNAWIESGNAAMFQIVSTDKHVSPIPLAAIDSLTVNIWKRIDRVKPREKKTVAELLEETIAKAIEARAAELLEEAAAGPVLARFVPQTTESMPDIDALIESNFCKTRKEELVGAGAESRGF